MSDAAVLEAPDPTRVRKLLDWIRIVAIVDFALLVPLVLGAVLDWGIAPVLGPIHGVGYLLLLGMCAKGAGERYWGWWFPALTLVTAGPPGSLLGDLKIRRDLVTA